jgi:hypothetical protein
MTDMPPHGFPPQTNLAAGTLQYNILDSQSGTCRERAAHGADRPAWSQSAQPATSSEDVKASQLLADGVRLMQSKKLTEAKFYSARNPAETLFYTLDAANSNKGSATVVSGNWSYAYYLKAYALLDLGRVSEAKVQLQRAVTLSP